MNHMFPSAPGAKPRGWLLPRMLDVGTPGFPTSSASACGVTSGSNGSTNSLKSLVGSPSSSRSRLIRPILLAANSVNQMFPSGPGRMNRGWLLPVGLSPAGKGGVGGTDVGIAKYVMAAAVFVGSITSGSKRPIRLVEFSLNQIFPSGPSVMPPGWLAGFGSGNSVIVSVVRSNMPMAFPNSSANQRLPFKSNACAIGRVLPKGLDGLGGRDVGIGNSVMSLVGSASLISAMFSRPIWLRELLREIHVAVRTGDYGRGLADGCWNEERPQSDVWHAERHHGDRRRQGGRAAVRGRCSGHDDMANCCAIGGNVE